MCVAARVVPPPLLPCCCCRRLLPPPACVCEISENEMAFPSLFARDFPSTLTHALTQRGGRHSPSHTQTRAPEARDLLSRSLAVSPTHTHAALSSFPLLRRSRGCCTRCPATEAARERRDECREKGATATTTTRKRRRGCNSRGRRLQGGRREGDSEKERERGIERERGSQGTAAAAGVVDPKQSGRERE